jgi:hypothetical protein
MREANDTAALVCGADFNLPNSYSGEMRRASAVGVELAAKNLAFALGLQGDARTAFLTASGVRDPA